MITKHSIRRLVVAALTLITILLLSLHLLVRLSTTRILEYYQDTGQQQGFLLAWEQVSNQLHIIQIDKMTITLPVPPMFLTIPIDTLTLTPKLTSLLAGRLECNWELVTLTGKLQGNTEFHITDQHLKLSLNTLSPLKLVELPQLKFLGVSTGTMSLDIPSLTVNSKHNYDGEVTISVKDLATYGPLALPSRSSRDKQQLPTIPKIDNTHLLLRGASNHQGLWTGQLELVSSLLATPTNISYQFGPDCHRANACYLEGRLCFAKDGHSLLQALLQIPQANDTPECHQLRWTHAQGLALSNSPYAAGF